MVLYTQPEALAIWVFTPSSGKEPSSLRSNKKYHHDYVGYNSRFDSLQTAVLSIKLKYIDEAIEKRASHTRQYQELLKNVSKIKIPVVKTKGLYWLDMPV